MNKKIYLLMPVLIVIITLISMMQGGTEYFPNYSFPDNLKITYFWQQNCDHCHKMEPMINELISKGVNVEKINIREYPALVIANGISGVPAMIINDYIVIGERSANELIEIIEEYA